MGRGVLEGVRVKRRGQVYWKGASAFEKRPEPRPERIPTWYHELPDALVVGAMFTPVSEPLGHFNAPGARTTPPTLTKLFFVTPGASSDLIVVPQNGLLVYAGMVRVQKKQADKVISMPKHTFVHGVGRYIIDDLDSIKPIE